MVEILQAISFDNYLIIIKGTFAFESAFTNFTY